MLYFNKKFILLAVLLVLSAPGAFASTSTVTSTPEIAPAPPTIDELRYQLESLKDNISISSEEKAAKELDLRKQILKLAVALSYEEIEKLSGRMDALPLLNDIEKGKATSSLSALSEYRNRYDAIKETLGQELTLEQTIALAQELKDWRAALYVPAMKEISNFVLALQQRSVIKTGFERRSKIETDIKKLFQSGYITDEQAISLGQMLNQAESFLNEAQLVNGDVYKLVFAGEAPADSSVTDTLIKASLEKIKSAYVVFLDMSGKVKEILGL